MSYIKKRPAHVGLLDAVIAKKPIQQNKLGNHWTTCRYDHRHQSKKEAARCEELELWQKGGLIEGLNRKVRFALIGKWSYESDFTYFVVADRRNFVIEDSKGRTDKADLAYRLFKLKADLLECIYGQRVFES